MSNEYLRGLLGEDEYESARQQALNSSLLAAGLQGLVASGPSLMPTSAGQALGQAGAAGMQAYGGAMDQAERQGVRALDLAQMRKEQEGQEAFKAALPQVFQNGKINYEAAQQLALAYPEQMGQIMKSLQATQRPTAPAINLQFDPKTGSVFNPRTGEVTYTGTAQEPDVNLQFDPKTNTVFNPRTGEVTRADGGQAQGAFTIPENATAQEAATIYRTEAQNIGSTDPAKAKQLMDLANSIDPKPPSKPPTDSQLKAGGFYDRMIQSVGIIDPLEDVGEYPMYGSAMAGSIPFVGDIAKRVVMSPEQQRYQQAADDWIRAKLRQESGAVISDDEMRSEYNTYFPQPGDSKEVIAQKRRSRQTATASMAKAAGPAVDLVQPSTNGDLAAQARAERERRQRGR